ncbi:MAG: 3-dehydroquinate synthase [Kangiellaceae bacterium]|nr:3-dehydroquinate synthase [Kangiellaceae bacterium]MCW8997144.1 3-dehydroquinate synthase [Kangiellaceae bacterium]
MRKLLLDLQERSYNITIGQNLLNRSDLVSGYCEGDKVLILTNKVVAPLFLDKIRTSLPDKNVFEFVIADGEAEKNLANYEAILDYLIRNQFRRNDTLIALGGGVVGDLGGFIAASYQRGMGLIQVPTTLLSQVDSSVGGKTAVNHPLGKNMIGAFYQPKGVIIDTDTLATLPEREFISGLAEVSKYAFLGEKRIQQILEQNVEDILAREPNVLEELIELSCAKKAAVVTDDEKEAGARALLNLGHTFGHAIEKITQYTTYLHGEAVAIGTHMAINLSISKSLIDQQTASRYRSIMNSIGLPAVANAEVKLLDMLESMKLDKKNQTDKYRLILPKDEGCEIVEQELTGELEKAISSQLSL